MSEFSFVTLHATIPGQKLLGIHEAVADSKAREELIGFLYDACPLSNKSSLRGIRIALDVGKRLGVLTRLRSGRGEA